MGIRPVGAGCDGCVNNREGPLSCGPAAYNLRCRLNPDISAHVPFSGMVDSETALARDLANCPGPDQLRRFSFIATNAYEHFVTSLGLDLALESSFRNEAVNAAVGGSPDSGHLLGEAVDMVIRDDATAAALTAALNAALNAGGESLSLRAADYRLVDAFLRIMADLPNDGLFHQIILETDPLEGSWIHYHCKNDGERAKPKPENRGEVFVLSKTSGLKRRVALSPGGLEVGLPPRRA